MGFRRPRRCCVVRLAVAVGVVACSSRSAPPPPEAPQPADAAPVAARADTPAADELREVMGANLRGVAPHPYGGIDPLREARDNPLDGRSPGEDLDKALDDVDAEGSIARRARWVLRRQCDDFSEDAARAHVVETALAEYRREHRDSEGDATLALVHRALARLYRCKLERRPALEFEAPPIGDFPPHPKPPGTPGRDDPTQ